MALVEPIERFFVIGSLWLVDGRVFLESWVLFWLTGSVCSLFECLLLEDY